MSPPVRRHRTAQHPDAATTAGVLAVRPDGSLFFGNADRVRLAVRDLVAHAEQDLARHALADRVGPDGLHRTVDDAVSAAAGGPV